MALRVYVCPWVGTGTRVDPYRSKAVDTMAGLEVSSFFPSSAGGRPASAWVLSMIHAADFTAMDADTTCDDLFGGNLPGTITGPADLITYLKSTTIGQVPVTRRKQIQAVLDKYGVVRSDFTNATILWKVMQRVAATLFTKDGNESRTTGQLEADDTFGSAF